MQDGARPHIVPTVHAGHYNHFLDQCIGHQEPIKWPPQSLVLCHVIFFCVDDRKRKSTNHNPKHLMKWNKQFKIIIATLPVDFLRKNVEFCVF